MNAVAESVKTLRHRGYYDYTNCAAPNVTDDHTYLNTDCSGIQV